MKIININNIKLCRKEAKIDIFMHIYRHIYVRYICIYTHIYVRYIYIYMYDTVSIIINNSYSSAKLEFLS